ncbi:methyl-accepting chemotaxis protein [Thiomicrorhabdus indica]|uniref:methyl-accepting chemotaxis protein n=1 Tax=Thiomicrorhabdus indica TaxID=2267253 RepID=UPI002AA7854F|nr:methyl-accepting chemotaxis protein [Thiomicrorhabdus indica]
MRNNQPVTQNEFDVPENQILVSKTDLQGNIIESNNAFEIVSGFSQEELIGNPHNIVRHPDVPSEIFADMWADLKQGIPWTQFVKNRRKNGDYYWVKAQATPIFEDEKIIGYMSVRSKATEQEKQQTQKAYQAIKDGKASIKHGQVYYGLRWPNLNPLTRFSPMQFLMLSVLVFSVIPSFLTLFGQLSLAAEGALFMSLGLMAVMATYGLFLQARVKQSMRNLCRIASKQAPEHIAYDPNSYLGQLVNAERSLYLASLEDREENLNRLDQAQQLQMAMDRMQTNIMTIDADCNIVYMNDNMKVFLQERESRLQTLLPDLDVQQALGANIDIFHKNPSHQRQMIAALTEKQVVKIEIAGIYFQLAMIPVFNRSGIRTSTLVEWLDLSEEVQLIENVNQVVEDAKKGYLGKRIDLSQVDGVAKDLSLSINQLLQSIQEAMDEVVKVTNGMAEGDLTHTIEKPYEGELGELMQSVNHSIMRLNRVVDSATKAAFIVGDTSNLVQSRSSDLGDRIQQQAAAIEETSATMNQMNSMIQNNTQNANQASNVAHEVQTKASQGAKVMNQTIEAMNQIQESSHRISEIVSMIDSIAFQTNLLALNAAVEAARAGDHGRGFAVVAGEVRSLAQKSADAAKEITSLIGESVERIDHGTRLASESGEFLQTIVNSVDEMTSMITEIASASNEQAQGINQVNVAIAEIDQTTQQNASVVDESTDAAMRLSEQANVLSKDMGYFKTIPHEESPLKLSIAS